LPPDKDMERLRLLPPARDMERLFLDFLFFLVTIALEPISLLRLLASDNAYKNIPLTKFSFTSLHYILLKDKNANKITITFNLI
jgi:hypothetical protein